MPLPGPGIYPDPALLPGAEQTFTAQVQQSLSPLPDPHGHHFLWLDAIGCMFEEVFSIVSDAGNPDDSTYIPGWSVLLDPVNCPTRFLPLLATFVGAPVPPGTDDATARSLITSEQGFARGTPASIVAAVQRTLSGSQSCVLLERTAANGSVDPYHFIVVVRPSEVVSVSLITQAVLSVKPAGLGWTLVQADSWTWNQAAHSWSADAMTWAASGSTQP